MMTNKNLIDLDVMSVEQIAKIVKRARKIMQSPADYRHACAGKILATLFYAHADVLSNGDAQARRTDDRL